MIEIILWPLSYCDHSFLPIGMCSIWAVLLLLVNQVQWYFPTDILQHCYVHHCIIDQMLYCCDGFTGSTYSSLLEFFPLVLIYCSHHIEVGFGQAVSFDLSSIIYPYEIITISSSFTLKRWYIPPINIIVPNIPDSSLQYNFCNFCFQ